MASPEIELQAAIYAALKGSTKVMALIDDIYDDVRPDEGSKQNGAPFGAKRGYISFGPETSIPDDYDGLSLDEVTVQLDVWSRKVGRVHCKAICRAVRDALKDVSLDLPTHGHVTTDLDLVRILPDPNEKIIHGVMQFTAHIEEGE